MAKKESKKKETPKAKYVKDNDIKDSNNKPFIMPSFGYSKDMFKGIDD